jgi:hypothetical protein
MRAVVVRRISACLIAIPKSGFGSYTFNMNQKEL